MSLSCDCMLHNLHGDPPRPFVECSGLTHAREHCETTHEVVAQRNRLADAVEAYLKALDCPSASADDLSLRDALRACGRGA